VENHSFRWKNIHLWWCRYKIIQRTRRSRRTRLLLADLAAEVDVIADDLRRWYIYADDLMPKQRN
jgi:hypothetical protein